MATQTKHRSHHDFDAAADRIRDFNKRAVDSGKAAGSVYLDLYERTLNGVADFEEQVAKTSQVEWVSALVKTQASLTRDLAGAYASAARQLLK